MRINLHHFQNRFKFRFQKYTNKFKGIIGALAYKDKFRNSWILHFIILHNIFLDFVISFDHLCVITIFSCIWRFAKPGARLHAYFRHWLYFFLNVWRYLRMVYIEVSQNWERSKKNTRTEPKLRGWKKNIQGKEDQNRSRFIQQVWKLSVSP